MVQWVWPPPWFSIGFHLDPRLGRTKRGLPFGPYADVHLFSATLSVGRNCWLTHMDMLDAQQARGGFRPDEF